jgi:Ni,Fe-hydrogenase III small subunit/formate hydrogenlyase subunit 6/NADH:ubiquinone oxidoreductase subunit I
MFKILNLTLRTGIVTARYPDGPADVPASFRGLPEFEFEKWDDARPAGEVCPTGAISLREGEGAREVTIDYGLCVYCGLCAETTRNRAVRITQNFETAAEDRQDLIKTARYELNPDGSHRRLLSVEQGRAEADPVIERAGRKVKEKISALYGRSLAIREVDAGSCNGCELEIHALNNPIYDIERFGIHFVASPRHADMLLVTGPVTRNMEMALRKTYMATPEPRLVVAVGACGISGGIFGRNYATVGAVDEVIPVDVYVPGCPPRPQALLHGILLAIGKAAKPSHLRR